MTMETQSTTRHRIPITLPIPDRFILIIRNDEHSLEKNVLVISHSGKFYGIEPLCPHSNGPLSKGEIVDIEDSSPSIICPWHQYEFDLSTGANEFVNAESWKIDRVGELLYITLEEGYTCTDRVSIVEKACDISSKLESISISPGLPTSLLEYAGYILNTVDPVEKTRLTAVAADLFLNHELPISNEKGDPRPPHAPPRDEANTVHYSRAGKLKKGGSGMV